MVGRVKSRKALVLKLALVHFALVLLFDVLAVYAPGIMTRSIGGDSLYYRYRICFGHRPVRYRLGFLLFRAHQSGRQEPYRTD